MPVEEKCPKRVRFELTDQSPECQLRFAAKYGSLHKIHQLVKTQKVDINCPNYNCHTPLTICILNEPERKCVELLCKLGADVNYTTDKIHGYCPLHFAAEHDNGEIIEVLLEHGARINTQTLTGCTPLHIAAMNGNLKAARYLCLNGADVNISEFYNGYTPVHYALLRGHKKVLQLIQEFHPTLGQHSYDNHRLTTMCQKVLWSYLNNSKREPKYLQHMCLQVIRKNFLQHSAYKSASRLPLPEKMKKKILLEDYC